MLQHIQQQLFCTYVVQVFRRFPLLRQFPADLLDHRVLSVPVGQLDRQDMRRIPSSHPSGRHYRFLWHLAFHAHPLRRVLQGFPAGLSVLVVLKKIKISFQIYFFLPIEVKDTVLSSTILNNVSVDIRNGTCEGKRQWDILLEKCFLKVCKFDLLLRID